MGQAVLFTRLRMTLVRKKIVGSIFTWVSFPANMEPWIRWPQQSKLLKLGWISLELQKSVTACSLTRKTWMMTVSQVYEWDLD